MPKKRSTKSKTKVNYFQSFSQRKGIGRKTMLLSSKRVMTIVILLFVASAITGIAILQKSRSSDAATPAAPNATNPLPITDMLWQNVTGEGPITRAEHAPFAGHQAARDDSIVAVSSPVNGKTKYSGLFTVRTGDQPGSTSGYRAEVYTGANSKGTELFGTDGYYSLSFYLPSDFQSPSWTILHQMHGSVSGSSPAIDIISQKNDLGIIIRGGTSANANKRQYKIESSITKGQWHEIVYYAKWRSDNQGQFKAWHRLAGQNSWKEVANTNGPLGYSINGNYFAPYPKLGVYRSTSNGNIVTRAYHGGIRLHAPSFVKAAEIFGGSSNVPTTPTSPTPTTPTTPTSPTPSTGSGSGITAPNNWSAWIPGAKSDGGTPVTRSQNGQLYIAFTDGVRGYKPLQWANYCLNIPSSLSVPKSITYSASYNPNGFNRVYMYVGDPSNKIMNITNTAGQSTTKTFTVPLSGKRKVCFGNETLSNIGNNVPNRYLKVNSYKFNY